MKIHVYSDWAEVSRPGIGSVKVPKLVGDFPVQSFQAFGSGDRCICVAEVDEETARQIAESGEYPSAPLLRALGGTECKHRGELVRIERCRTCPGGIGTKAKVYVCHKLATVCTIFPAGVAANGEPAPVCNACEHKESPE